MLPYKKYKHLIALKMYCKLFDITKLHSKRIGK